MKKLFTTALATLVAVYGYSQDGVHLPLTGGHITGNLNVSGLATFYNNLNVAGGGTFGSALIPGADTNPAPYKIRTQNNYFVFNGGTNGYSFQNHDGTAGGAVTMGALTGTSATFSGGITAQTNNITSNVSGGGFYHSAVNAGMYGDSGYLRLTNWYSQLKGINIQVSTGNVGIGTNTPLTALHLGSGTIRVDGASPTLYLRGGATGEKGRITLNHYGYLSWDVTAGDAANGSFLYLRQEHLMGL